MIDDARVRARSFDAWAAEYDRYRPHYPNALFDLVAERLDLPESASVADLGAGTGRASIAMARRGWRVTAVEPGEPMLAVLRATAASIGLDVATVVGSAEASCLADASVDLATAAQAFHWFDKPRALAEMARVVRPRGGIALFWNVRDTEASAFLAEYRDLVHGYGQGVDARPAGPREETRQLIEAAGSFEGVAFEQLRHAMSMTASDFIGMAFTASYIGTLPEEEQTKFRAALGELLARHGHDQGSFEVPYRVDAWIARRRET